MKKSGISAHHADTLGLPSIQHNKRILPEHLVNMIHMDLREYTICYKYYSVTPQTPYQYDVRGLLTNH